MEVLKVDNISKGFGGLSVLKGLSFSVESGEYLALVGPNGAGKTTLLNVLSGDLSHDGGQIYLLGQEISNMAVHRRTHLGIARSFQLNSLFFKLPLMHNILLAIQAPKASWSQMFRPITSYNHLLTEAGKLLQSIGLWEKRNIPVEALSYGEQRRVEVALSLASKPKLLLLDEPTTGLSRDEITNFIDMLRRLGKDVAVFFAAHDMDVVFALATRIIVLYYGQLIAQGGVEEIRNNPKVKEIYLGVEEKDSAGIN